MSQFLMFVFHQVVAVVAPRSLPTLERLTLGKGFHQPLPAGALPATLRALTLHGLSEVVLPEQLRELTAGPKVNGMEKVTFPRRACCGFFGGLKMEILENPGANKEVGGVTCSVGGSLILGLVLDEASRVVSMHQLA